MMRVLKDLWRAWRFGVTWPICALLLLPVSVSGQVIPPSPVGLTAQFSSTCAASTCATWAVGTASSIGLSIVGGGSWTVTIKVSADNGNTYFDASVINLADGSSTTTVTDAQDGDYAIANSGFTHLQVRMTTWASGGANVWAIRGYSKPNWLSPFLTRLYTGDGTCPLPAWSFKNDPDLGVYRVGANNLAFCAASANLLDINTTRILSTIPFLGPDGAAGAPNFSFGSDSTKGIYSPTTNQVGVAIAGAFAHKFTLSGFQIMDTGGSLGFGSGTGDLFLFRDAANTLAQRNGTNAQTFNLYNTTNGTDKEFLQSTWAANVAYIQTNSAGAGAARGLIIRTGGSAELGFGVNGATNWRINTGNLLTQTDNAYAIGNGTGTLTRPSSLFLAAPAITVGSGTGITVNNAGEVRTLEYIVTVASTAFVCNDVTCDVTIGTLPANTKLWPSLAIINTTFACTATCTSSTLSFVLGKGSGGAEYLASFDADAATGTFGDADAELGTLLTRAAAIGGGTINTSSQAVVLRLTSGTGNIGNGSATNLSQGSVTIKLFHTVY